MTDTAELIARLQAAALAEIDPLYQEAATALAAQAQEIAQLRSDAQRRHLREASSSSTLPQV